MARQIIYATPLTSFKSAVWYGQAVYRQYAKLKNHLKQHLGEEYAHFFAEPHISDDDLQGFSKPTWSSEVISKNAIPFTQLSESAQSVVLPILEQRIQAIQGYAQKMLQSEHTEDNRWGQLMLKALEIPGYEQILVENNTPVLVVWGFTQNPPEGDGAQAKGSFPLKSATFSEITPPNSFNEPPPKPAEPPSEEQETENEAPDSNLNTQNPTKIPEATSTPQAPASDEDKNNSTDDSQAKPGSPFKKQQAAKSNAASSGKSKTAGTPKNTKQALEPLPQKEETQTPPPTSPPVLAHPAAGCLRFWWVALLLLLLLLLLFFGLRACSGGSTALPDQPGVVVPIDSTKIEPAPDSSAFIIADRLNIALSGNNKNIQAFANAFKKQYPGSAYKIIYYDTLTCRIQIQVPAAERDTIKNALPGQLPEFKMLIWYEGMFERSGVPNDPAFGDIRTYWYIDRVHAQAVWNTNRGDSALVIAIIDDGFDLNHPELKGKIYKPWNVPAHSPDVNTGKSSYHGTHVAGTATAWADNRMGATGIAPNCKLMPIQVGDYNGLMSSTAIIDGVLYAINQGASVINMSLGLKMPDEINSFPAPVQREMINTYFKEEEVFWNELFRMAYDRNVVVVLAGGNQDIMIGVDPMQRTPYTINVSATDPRNSKASFSNFGEYSTISAPGVEVFNTVPGGKYDFLSGTSMAAPVVSGGIALLKSINPALSFDQIVDIIQSTGIPVAAPPDRPIGPLLQLDKAAGLAGAQRQKMPIANCPEAQRKIDSLLQEIDKIRRMCPQDSTTTDTMRMPPKLQDLSFAEGRWKSTTYIHNEEGEKVTLYYDFFANGSGKITLIESDNTQCVAELGLSIRNNTFLVSQKGQAICTPPPRNYNPYYFECKPDASGCAECSAQNKVNQNNRFTFRLVKIR